MKIFNTSGELILETDLESLSGADILDKLSEKAHRICVEIENLEQS